MNYCIGLEFIIIRQTFLPRTPRQGNVELPHVVEIARRNSRTDVTESLLAGGKIRGKYDLNHKPNGLVPVDRLRLALCAFLKVSPIEAQTDVGSACLSWRIVQEKCLKMRREAAVTAFNTLHVEAAFSVQQDYQRFSF
jgi:hypothetical protein